MGGRVTFLASLELALGAAVGFYGGGIVTARFPQFPPLIDRVGSLQTPWLGLFGDEDGSIPVDDVERLRAELDGADVPAEVVRYAGAEHGFHCDQRPSYHAEAATDAWARTLAWFEEHLEPERLTRSTAGRLHPWETCHEALDEKLIDVDRRAARVLRGHRAGGRGPREPLAEGA